MPIAPDADGGEKSGLDPWRGMTRNITWKQHLDSTGKTTPPFTMVEQATARQADILSLTRRIR
jgi:hypothetical protein